MKAPLKVEVLTGPPGSGKTRQMRLDAVAEPGLYAFAFPGIELLEEQAGEFKQAGLPFWKVHSETNGRAAIQKQLNEQLKRIAAAGVTHGAVLMTHYALVACDHSGMEGWRWRIDEAPTFHTNGVVKVAAGDLELWKRAIALKGQDGGWSIAVAKTSRTLSDLKHGLFKEHADLLKAASRGAALIATDKWEAGRHAWLSLWTPRALPSPHSIVISGAGFSRSISALAFQEFFAGQIAITEQVADRPRTAQPDVHIHHFAAWEASSSHWDSHGGRGDLKAIAAHIRKHQPDLGYWSGNEQVQLLMDHYIAPIEARAAKAAGLNKHDQATSTAYIYSSKATPQDIGLLEAIGLTADQIRTAREDEDIFQFVFRGSIRRPEFGGRYDIWLFSQQQAGRLATMLREAGLAKVSLHKADAGVSAQAPQRPKKGRPRKHIGETKDEKRARLANEQMARRHRKKRTEHA